ncbi:MAG TPA: sugar transferase, partial [Ktedonobacterales bacterium]|nr:sugar transferase [Ktedonobacterales bacterium]
MKATTPLSTRWERRLVDQPAVVAPIAADAADATLVALALSARSAEYRAWRRGRGGAYFALKRALDMGAALLALLLSAPLLLLIAALIWLEDDGPVIYTRQVIGERGRLFTMYKFRTMCERAEELLQQDAALMAEYQRQHFKL